MIKEIEKTREYLNYLEKHYDNVQRAWRIIQTNCADMPFVSDEMTRGFIQRRIERHDESKLSQEEFVPYRRHFYPVDPYDKTQSGFKEAWTLHLQHNVHHWQNWTTKTMNQMAAFVENMADWIAMSLEFGGTARDYYEENKSLIKFPEWAITEMNEIFDRVYGKRGINE